jgi:hypothetical protein
LTVAVTFACASCGRKTIFPVTGKVTYKGAPAKNAAVFFCRRGVDPVREHLIMGIVQEDGTFELVCGSMGKGAPPGDYDVLIEWKEPTGRREGSPGRAADRLKRRYADPKNPLLHAAVEAKSNNLAPFELADGEPFRKR